MNRRIRNFLYRSFDGKLRKEDQNLLEEALSRSPNLSREKRQIEIMRKRLVLQTHFSFRERFADRVMVQIKLLKTMDVGALFHESVFQFFRPMAIAATILIIAMISYNLVKSDRVSWEDVMVVPEVTIEDAYDPLLALNEE